MLAFNSLKDERVHKKYMTNITHIPIVFDKSHLLTIGERLYATSLDLIRELVSNAYDADATTVNFHGLTPMALAEYKLRLPAVLSTLLLNVFAYR